MKNIKTTAYFNPYEIKVIARLSYEKAAIVTRSQLNQWLHFSPKIMSKTIFRLISKKVLRKINRETYFYSPIESGPYGVNINEFLIPPVLFPKGNYYLGYSMMYNYYGFLDQIPQTMHILNTTVQRQKYIGNMLYKLLRVPSSRIYGVEEINIKGQKVIVSDKERTLVDMIYFPDPVGGLKNAFDILKKQLGTIDVKKLVKYAAGFPNTSTRKRIGYVLESAGVSEKTLHPLRKSINRYSLATLYYSENRKGSINKQWGLIVNAA